MDDLAKNIQTYGWLTAGAMFLVIRIGPTLGIWFKKLGDHAVDRLIASREMNPTKKDILNHRFYGFMNVSIKYHIDSIQIENEYKRAVCHDFLKIKFTIARDELTKLFSDDSLYDLSTEEFHGRIEFEMARIIDMYNKAGIAEGIPPLFIEKFSKWHEKTIEMVQSFVKDVCQSQWIQGNYRTAYSLQNEFLRAFILTITDAEKTISTINGAFVGMTYKGILCQPDKYH